MGYGRLIGVRPVTAAFGPLRIVLGEWTNDVRAVGQYVGVPMLGLAARGVPSSPELSCETLAPHKPQGNGSGDPLDDLVAVASGHPPAEAKGERTDDVGGFTLKQLLVLMTVMSVVLALTRLLPRSVAAFVLGLVALFGLVTVHDTRSRPAIVRLAWWLLLAIYLFTAIGAVLGL